MIKHYSIGLDFGTLAGRAVLTDNHDGSVIAESVFKYRNAIISDHLPGDKQPLPQGFALQDPGDYIEAVPCLIRDTVERSGVDPALITGIGVDSTASTVLPVDRDFRPLCLDERFRKDPHAWIKLWKHGTTQKQAEKLNRAAAAGDEPFLKHCGGKMSAEWYWAKILETAEESPAVFDAAYTFLELGDWLVYLLTGEKQRSGAIAAIHAQWDPVTGYPPGSFFKRVGGRAEAALEKTLRVPVLMPYTAAGTITEEICEKTGLSPAVRVSTAMTDSPVALLSLGIMDERQAALILGTSSVMIPLSREERYVKGAMAAVRDVLVPGLYGNMFGQPAAGDIFDWFVNQLVPYRFYEEARENNESVFQVLNRRMSALKPGENGLVALDWFNGNRCMLQNMDLSGAVVGLSLSTTAEQLYRGLVESVAYGLRAMKEAASDAGIGIGEIFACGGIARKSPEIMQIFADILEVPISVSDALQTNAHGAAIMGAVAAGSAAGGYGSYAEAVASMHQQASDRYVPDAENAEAYRKHFAKYMRLYRCFGEEDPGFMQELKQDRSCRDH